MNENFLLKDEFENWLINQPGTLFYKPLFYSSQILKLKQLEKQLINSSRFFDHLENDILCDNQEGIEKNSIPLIPQVYHIKKRKVL